MVGPAPHLNGHYTVFGEAVDGFEVKGGVFDGVCCVSGVLSTTA